MSDTLVARGSDSKYTPHPDGQFIAQCVDVIDLGQKVQDFSGSEPYLAPTCALVFRTGERNEETGDFIDVSKEFTVSMGDRANLRKFLEQWRGKPYDADAVKAGVPLHKLEGQHALLTVSQKVSGKGKTYANITACVGVPKQMQGGLGSYLGNYKRDPYWETKKKQYAEAASLFRAQDDDAPREEYEETMLSESDYPF